MELINPKEDIKEIIEQEKTSAAEVKTVSITEYVQNEFATFSEKPLSPVDSLVFAQLSYMNVEDVVPSEYEEKPSVTIQNLYRAELFDKYIKGIFMPQQTRKLIDAVCSSPRFRDVKINYFAKSDDNTREKQFCAMTFFLPTGDIYVAYRGTDNSINGWKEDFNMFFLDTIPGQHSAIKYLNAVAEKTTGNIYIGGHSKGGNLSLYAGSFADDELQKRIVQVFNHDGPGLTRGAMAKPEYKNISEKLHTTLPHESIVGLIFSNGDYNVVSSRRVGILQHDTFAWKIRDGEFIYEKEVKPGANKLIDAVYELIDTLDVDTRELFVDTVFEIIYSAGAVNLSDFPAMVISQREKVMETINSLEPETAEKLKAVMAEFVKIIARKNFSLPEAEQAKLNETIAKITDTTERISRAVSGTAEKLSRTKERFVADSAAAITDTTEKITQAVSETAEKITRTKNLITDRINRGTTIIGDTAGRIGSFFAKREKTEDDTPAIEEEIITEL